MKKGIQDVEFCFPTTTIATSSPQNNNNESNNKILYQKKTRKKSWTMWKYVRELRPYRERRWNNIVEEKKKHNTSLLCLCLCMWAFLASLCVFVKTETGVSNDMKKKWKMGFGVLGKEWMWMNENHIKGVIELMDGWYNTLQPEWNVRLQCLEFVVVEKNRMAPHPIQTIHIV